MGLPAALVRRADGARTRCDVRSPRGAPQVDARVAIGDVRTMERSSEITPPAADRRGADRRVRARRAAARRDGPVRRGVELRDAPSPRDRGAAGIGADHGRVLRLVLGEGAMLVGIGGLLGAPGIYAAGRLIRGVLVGSRRRSAHAGGCSRGFGARYDGCVLPAGATGDGHRSSAVATSGMTRTSISSRSAPRAHRPDRESCTAPASPSSRYPAAARLRR